MPPLIAAARLLLAVALLAAVPASGRAQSGGLDPPPAPEPENAAHPAFRTAGMWIWQLPRAHGGDVARIVDKARRHGVETLFVKSGDGVNRWRQFTPEVVRAFQDAGLYVCGWQYVYGNKPIAEANAAAWAKRAGADCFVIDAEAEYQGKYVAADRYVRRLRALVGRRYPIGLAPFPYVDYHPGFPYSVFLAPGAAQANQPQMYWKTIGTTPDANFAHTYVWSRLYGRPIFPLGQTYDRAPPAQIRRFRQIARGYGAQGVSWWEWSQTAEAAWRALGDPVATLSQYQPATRYPTLRMRARGDFVVWAQQHLWTAGYGIPLDGVFGPATREAVLDFQAGRGIAQTGALDDPTWRALLRLEPVAVRWRTVRRRATAFPARASRRGVVVAPAPRSARLAARAYEIPRRR